MAGFGDGLASLGGLDSLGGIGGGPASTGPHITFSSQLFSEPLRRGEVQTWEGDGKDIVNAFNGIKVGAPTSHYRHITAANDDWGTPYVAGVQAPRRTGGVWTMNVTVAQLRKCVLWTLDFAEIQKDIRTWRQNQSDVDDAEPDDSIPDLSILSQWERAKEVLDWDDYNNFKTVDGKALEDGTLELAKMIRKGIESYTIHTPVPTMTMRYFDEVKGTGALLDKYLTSLPTGPSGWKELGGAEVHDQLNDLSIFHTDGSGAIGTISYRWLCVSDKSTPNGDGSCTRVVQFMRVDKVEDNLYSMGNAAEGGLA